MRDRIIDRTNQLRYLNILYRSSIPSWPCTAPQLGVNLVFTFGPEGCSEYPFSLKLSTQLPKDFVRRRFATEIFAIWRTPGGGARICVVMRARIWVIYRENP